MGVYNVALALTETYLSVCVPTQAMSRLIAASGSDFTGADPSPNTSEHKSMLACIPHVILRSSFMKILLSFLNVLIEENIAT